MEMITVCVKNTYFQYGQEFYKQEKEMAMGSPLSSVLCNLFLEDLEEWAISSFRSKPEVFVRYMDDIFFVWQQGECNISGFHTHLNDQDSNIRFTIELEDNGKIPFLDVLLSRATGCLATEVYKKPTNSDLYLQYDSCHPKSAKNGIVNTLLHRAETHSSCNESYNREIVNVERVLEKNKYPISLVKNINRKRKQQRVKKEIEKPDATVVIPYVPILSEKIIKIGHKSNIRVVCRSIMMRLLSCRPPQARFFTDSIHKIFVNFIPFGITMRTK
jgi:hypothetical protein